MTARTQLHTRGRPAMLAQLAGPWWMFLVTGVAWLIISAAVWAFVGPYGAFWALATIEGGAAREGARSAGGC